MRKYSSAGLTGVMALVLGAACSPGDNARNDSLASGATTAGGDSAAAATATPTADFTQMSEPNIASTIGVINGGEIQAAELATTNASSADVKAFARDMIREHRAMQKGVDSLATAKNLTPEPGANSQAIQTEMNTMMQQLGQLSGASFDSAYMQGQVADHQKALDALNGMASAAQDADLRTMIQGAIPKVQSHLERARTLAQKVGGASAGTTGAMTDTSRNDTARNDTARSDTTRR